jgi:U2-associated protein SR140
VSTFEDNPQQKLNKTWVKAGTFNAGNRREDTTEKGKLYKPQTKLELPVKDAASDKVKIKKYYLL